MSIPYDTELDKDFFEAYKDKHIPLEDVERMLKAKKGRILAICRWHNVANTSHGCDAYPLNLRNKLTNEYIRRDLDFPTFKKDTHLIETYFLYGI